MMIMVMITMMLMMIVMIVVIIVMIMDAIRFPDTIPKIRSLLFNSRKMKDFGQDPLYPPIAGNQG
jgi:biopolymer transport protein ExbB/TolQ